MMNTDFVRLPPLATHLGMSISGTRKLIAKGIFPVYRPTRRLILVKLHEVDEALAKYRTGGTR